MAHGGPADPTVGSGKEIPVFRKASKLAVTKARSNPRGNGQVTHDWLLNQYRRKLTKNGMEPEKVPLFKLHSPRIIGATAMFASGKVRDTHMQFERPMVRQHCIYLRSVVSGDGPRGGKSDGKDKRLTVYGMR